MELDANRYSDAVYLLDDLHPASTYAEQKILSGKLDAIVRIYADRVPPHRMGRDYNMSKENKPTGLCMITGELIDGVESCLARCLVVNNDANSSCRKDLLTYYQNNGIFISTYFYNFIKWLAPRFNSLIGVIKNLYPEVRSQYNVKNVHARYADVYAAYQVTAMIMSKYSIEVGAMTNEHANNFRNKVEKAVIETIIANSDLIIDVDPALIIIYAINNMLQSGEIKLPMYKKGEKPPTGILMFQDESALYFSPSEIEKYLHQYYRQRQSYLPINTTSSLLLELDRKGLIVTEQEKQNGRTVTKRTIKVTFADGSRVRYMKIIKSVFFALLEKNSI